MPQVSFPHNRMHGFLLVLFMLAVGTLVYVYMLQLLPSTRRTGWTGVSLVTVKKSSSLGTPMIETFFDLEKSYNLPSNSSIASKCPYWIVVAAVKSKPTVAIQRAAALSFSEDDGGGWCIVVVADKKIRRNYAKEAGFLFNHRAQENIHFLSIRDQKKMMKKNNLGKFSHDIQLGHASRKNIGYLYAIQRGANLIFDMSDDHALNLDNRGKVVSPLPSLSTVRVPLLGNKIAFNHLPLMGVSGESAPGFPLSLSHDKATHGMVAYETENITLSNLAVLQICADGEQNLEAAKQVIDQDPNTFEGTNSTNSTNSTNTPLIVPLHTFSPYNAHSTIHTQQAHWALLLPVTLPSELSHIWRSYMAQALYRHLDLHVAYVPSRVTQIYNTPKQQSDPKEESALNNQTENLLEFLQGWQCTNVPESYEPNVPYCMEQLWITLYEHQYIGHSDVMLVQLWLKALIECGYKFPTIQPNKRQRHDDIVVMGQFNYPNTLRDVLFWNQKWRQWVGRTQVRGPFSQGELTDMRAHGIEAFEGRNDKGWVSPYENLMRTLKQYHGKEGVTGVLYVHDDALVNIPKLFPHGDSHRGQNVLVNFDVRDPRQPLDANHAMWIESSAYKILKDGVTFAKDSGFQTQSVDYLFTVLNTGDYNWPWHLKCIPAFQSVSRDPRSHPYRESDESFLVTGKGQSDFLYVPMQHAQEFVKAARLFADYNVFLECGIPKLVDILRRGPSNATLAQVGVCTSWHPTRNTVRMIDICDKSPVSYFVFHPFKMHQRGYKAWGDAFDQVCSLK